MCSFRVRYQTLEIGPLDIHLRTLRNNQEFSDPLGIAKKLGISSATWPLFGVVWPSSLLLANEILDYDTADKRILEIGCGIGLTSLLLNKRNVDISATDYHPEVESFLIENTSLNGGAPIPFERADWSDLNTDLGRFDTIIGSDLLYEDEHIEMLAKFIELHANPACEVLIVDPGRGRKQKFSKQMADFGFTHTHTKPENTDYLAAPFKGHILTFKRK